MSFLNEMLPDTAEAFGEMRNSIFENGVLDQIGWTNVYSKNIYDSIFEEKEPEKPEGKKGCCCGD